MPLTVTGFDHIVLMVRDQETSLHFYGDILGMEQLRVSDWREGRAPFPSVRVSHASIIDLLAKREDVAGVALDHFCLVIDSSNWQKVLEELGENGVTIEENKPRKGGELSAGATLYSYRTQTDTVLS